MSEWGGGGRGLMINEMNMYLVLNSGGGGGGRFHVSQLQPET